MQKLKKVNVLCLLLVVAICVAPAQERKLREPDVVFVPTPQNVVDEMMKLAKVGKGDVVYDLGCGDGRLVITAAKLGAAKAVGIDINPERIRESVENAKQAGVAEKVQFRNEDLFEANFRDATVITLYLLNSLNLKLRPKLWKELKPGTRIVSHSFDMGDWKPDKEMDVDGRRIYFWTIPADAAAKAN
jgi:tRNA G37 N-methylase Trm5